MYPDYQTTQMKITIQYYPTDGTYNTKWPTILGYNTRRLLDYHIHKHKFKKYIYIGLPIGGIKITY